MTESIFSEHDKTLKDVTGLFKQQGVLFAIDDFGMKLLDAAAETQELKELKEFPYGIQG